MAPDLGAADMGRVRRLMSIASCGVAASDVRCSSGSSTTPGEHLRMLTVHAPDAGAARFYERCGFDRAPGLPITHVRSLARRP